MKHNVFAVSFSWRVVCVHSLWFCVLLLRVPLSSCGVQLRPKKNRQKRIRRAEEYNPLVEDWRRCFLEGAKF